MWWSSSATRKNRSRYRSSRSVRRARHETTPLTWTDTWTRAKICLLVSGLAVMGIVTLTPMMVLEGLEKDLKKSGQVVGLSSLLHRSEKAVSFLASSSSQSAAQAVPNHVSSDTRTDTKARNYNNLTRGQKHTKRREAKLHPIIPQEEGEKDLGRGVSGLPMAETPALVGAKRGHVQCDMDVDDLAYWNDPQGKRDVEFKGHYQKPADRYLTFEADCGGWNNIRMSLETIFVLAAATGRTLVLPPKAPFYLFGDGKEGARSFANFFNLSNFGERISVITMKEFVETQGKRLLGLTPEQLTKLLPVAEMCLHQPKVKSDLSCEYLYHDLLRKKGVQPAMEGQRNCLIFSEKVFDGGNLTVEEQDRVHQFCGNRTQVFYNHDLHDPPLIHWQAVELKYRLLNHFYAFMYFMDPAVDNYYKRFVRDFLHYHDAIFCAAGKIVHSLPKVFSALHIRRGDLQYKEVKISAEEWYNNTKEIWKPNETLYIATDERNKTWFDPIAKHHPLKFLDDFWDYAKLGDLDSSFLGMVDTVVASKGRAFAGTWFSTFSSFIIRLRGYHGFPAGTSWYSYLPRKTIMQTWESPHGNYHVREFQTGWVGIDGDTHVENERILPPPNEVSTAVNHVKSPPKVADVVNRTMPKLSLPDLKPDSGFTTKAVARGLAGRPSSETPALDGSSRAHIECDVNVDSLAYWNDPQGTRDVNYKSPFAVKDDAKYISFSPDRGGWNNIRMSMEIIFVIAAASGRTLVLPPEQPLYLLQKDKGKKVRGFADFFPLHTVEFQKRVPVITTEEFLRREGGRDGRLPVPEESRETVFKAAEHCIKLKKSDRPCDSVSDYLQAVGHMPAFRGKDGCVVFDEDAYHGKQITPDHEKSAIDFCEQRNITYWNKEQEDPVLIHFPADIKEFRLLTHYYLMLHFTNPVIDHYYKRFVRDFLHYHDTIYCAAGKIVKAIQSEGESRGFAVNKEGGGGYSAMHIRRGDFQYKRVKIPAEEWYDNTKEIWQPKEILYIATDERNKTWFDPIASHHTLRFLDDYWDLAGLADADPNHFGMIDTIVASRARAFAGTWFSTFSGYINRMRGYHGMTMTDSWYSFLTKKTAVHEWKNYSGMAYAYESPVGWIGIDADVLPSKDKF